VGGGDPHSLKAISCRFTSPVKLGGMMLFLYLLVRVGIFIFDVCVHIDILQVNVWELGPGPDGSTEYAFDTMNQTTGMLSLGGGVAYIKNSAKSKL
jgi:hypothetical protein